MSLHDFPRLSFCNRSDCGRSLDRDNMNLHRSCPEHGRIHHAWAKHEKFQTKLI